MAALGVVYTLYLLPNHFPRLCLLYISWSTPTFHSTGKSVLGTGSEDVTFFFWCSPPQQWPPPIYVVCFHGTALPAFRFGKLMYAWLLVVQVPTHSMPTTAVWMDAGRCHHGCSQRSFLPYLLPNLLSRLCHLARVVPQAKDSTVLVEGCLFDTCYASKKGGGLLQESGQLSVVGTLFYNNTAGSNNVESGERSKQMRAELQLRGRHLHRGVVSQSWGRCSQSLPSPPPTTVRALGSGDLSLIHTRNQVD